MLAPTASYPSSGSSARERFLDLIAGRRRGVVPTLLRLGLWIAACCYGLAVRLRQLAYDRGWLEVTRVGVPVVSVGNLTVGGTGKTPCVEYVARFYRDRELSVAILSRGYGSTSGSNDEALVLEENLPDVPHLQGADRAALARTATLELESEILVLDDGFQHRRLARDLDVVLIDATLPWGYGHLLPRGLLREPPSGLRRADAVVLTRCDQADPERLAALRQRVARLAPAAVVARAVHRPETLIGTGGRQAPLSLLRQHPVAGFCGIGNPEAFRRTLIELGAEVVDFRAYPDHHAYTRSDVEELRRRTQDLPADVLLVTTQKDLVKLRVDRLEGRPLWAVRIQLELLAGRAELDALLGRVLAP